MKIMIHTCPERLWYVEEFLVPSLIAQGIDDIKVWNDERRVGNLASCLASFASCSGGETWHMQDDVVIACTTGGCSADCGTDCSADCTLDLS